MKETKKKIHYAWVMALIGGLTMFCMSAQQMSQAVFLPRVAESLNVGMGPIGIAFSMVTIASLFLTPVFTRLYEKFPARLVTLGAVLGQCVSLILVSTARSIYQVAIAGVFESCTLAGYNNVLTSVIVGRWFKDRGQFAYNVILFISMLGGVLFTPIAGAIIAATSWRTAYLCLLGFLVVVTIPVIRIFFKESPEKIGLRPYEDPNAEKSNAVKTRPVMNAGLTTKQAWRSKDFWLVCIYMIAFSYPMTMPNHLSAHLESVGYATAVGVSVATASMVGGLSGRIVLGYLSGRLSLQTINAIYCGVGILSAIAFCFGGVIGAVGAVVTSFLFGAAVRAAVVQYSMLRYKVFGASHDYVGISANLAICAHLVIATSSTMYGMIYDATGSYNGGFILVIAMFAIAALLPFMILRSRKEQSAEANAAQSVEPT